MQSAHASSAKQVVRISTRTARLHVMSALLGSMLPLAHRRARPPTGGDLHDATGAVVGERCGRGRWRIRTKLAALAAAVAAMIRAVARFAARLARGIAGVAEEARHAHAGAKRASLALAHAAVRMAALVAAKGLALLARSVAHQPRVARATAAAHKIAKRVEARATDAAAARGAV